MTCRRSEKQERNLLEVLLQLCESLSRPHKIYDQSEIHPTVRLLVGSGSSWLPVHCRDNEAGRKRKISRNLKWVVRLKCWIKIRLKPSRVCPGTYWMSAAEESSNDFFFIFIDLFYVKLSIKAVLMLQGEEPQESLSLARTLKYHLEGNFRFSTTDSSTLERIPKSWRSSFHYTYYCVILRPRRACWTPPGSNAAL